MSSFLIWLLMVAGSLMALVYGAMRGDYIVVILAVVVLLGTLFLLDPKDI